MSSTAASTSRAAPFSPELWASLDAPQRAEFLSQGLDLIGQARSSSSLSLSLCDLSWGSGHQFHESPLPGLISEGDFEGALQALDLGASPFGANHQHDAWSASLRQLDLYPHQPFARLLDTLFFRLWRGALSQLESDPQIDPLNQSRLRYHLALRFHSSKEATQRHLCSLGIEPPLRWLLDCPDSNALVTLGPRALSEFPLATLRSLGELGFDFTAPARNLNDLPGTEASLWCWMHTGWPQWQERAAFLLDSGNDPSQLSIDFNGQAAVPLHLWAEDPSDQPILEFLNGLLLARRERSALEALGAGSRGASKRPSL